MLSKISEIKIIVLLLLLLIIDIITRTKYRAEIHPQYIILRPRRVEYFVCK